MSERVATYRFCPQCGSTVTYVNEGMPGLVALPIGAFADLHFPGPRFSVYEERKHAWVAVLSDDVEHQESVRRSSNIAAVSSICTRQ